MEEESRIKICPLLLIGKDPAVLAKAYCKKNDCAWWDETLNGCVVMNLHQLQPK